MIGRWAMRDLPTPSARLRMSRDEIYWRFDRHPIRIGHHIIEMLP
jgi:hypothetical protein